MANLNKLKGMIITKFGTYKAFAKEIDSDLTQVSLLVNGKRQFSIQTAKLYSITLGIDDFDTFKEIFF